MAYTLRNMDPEALALLDPRPARSPTELPENLQRLNDFSQFLAQKAQNASPGD
jgi:hypothetical protein